MGAGEKIEKDDLGETNATGVLALSGVPDLQIHLVALTAFTEIIDHVIDRVGFCSLCRGAGSGIDREEN